MQQNIAGEVDIFVIHTEFSCESITKYFENLSTIAKVIIKHQGVYFFWDTVYMRNCNLRCGLQIFHDVALPVRELVSEIADRKRIEFL